METIAAPRPTNAITATCAAPLVDVTATQTNAAPTARVGDRKQQPQRRDSSARKIRHHPASKEETTSGSTTIAIIRRSRIDRSAPSDQRLAASCQSGSDPRPQRWPRRIPLVPARTVWRPSTSIAIDQLATRRGVVDIPETTGNGRNRSSCQANTWPPLTRRHTTCPEDTASDAGTTFVLDAVRRCHVRLDTARREAQKRLTEQPPHDHHMRRPDATLSFWSPLKHSRADPPPRAENRRFEPQNRSTASPSADHQTQTPGHTARPPPRSTPLHKRQTTNPHIVGRALQPDNTSTPEYRPRPSVLD